jgi:hypothetical protein
MLLLLLLTPLLGVVMLPLLLQLALLPLLLLQLRKVNIIQCGLHPSPRAPLTEYTHLFCLIICRRSMSFLICSGSGSSSTSFLLQDQQAHAAAVEQQSS